MSQEDRAKQIGLVKKLIKIRYPHANIDAMVFGYSSGKNPMDIVYKGPKGGETKVVLEDGSDLQKSLLKIAAVKKQLGPPAGDIIQRTSLDIRKKQKELKALRSSERLLRSKNDEVRNMQERIKEEQARLDQLKEDQETGNKEDIRKKEQLLKTLKKDLKDRQKETKEFQKKIEAQEIAEGKIAKRQSSILEEERKRNAMEENLNSTKTFDALKEQEAHLQRLNEEDLAIIQDEMSPSLEKEAAEERVAARNEELARLQTQIAEREGAMPLRERVREIFKKYGVTVASIFLAAGVTIGAVVGATTNALKAMGKQIAGGLKNLGAKAASALPGLIGSVVSFLFRTAGQAIGFLAEHTWLLILAVVAFLFQKLAGRQKQ